VIDFEAYDALTFDCYGTLVDWERGILEALMPVLAGHRVDAGGPEAALERFSYLESAIEAEAFRPYRSVLSAVMRGFGRELGFEPTAAEVSAFAASVVDWPPFPDTVTALRALAGRYRLAVVSNVDDDLFAGTARKLAVPFAAVVTAEQVGSYKPARAHFDEVLRRLALSRERVLHVAQSLFHDIAPARELGFSTVWVNRRAGKAGGGATPPAAATPDLEVPDLATLVASMGLEG
jgi:2-haloacid dehalogenase